MSSYLLAGQTKVKSGDPVNDTDLTITLSGTNPIQAGATVGGAMTYFKGQFDSNQSVKKAEALVTNVAITDKDKREISVELDAQLKKNSDNNADVSIQAYAIATMETNESAAETGLFVIENTKVHNNDSGSVNFDSDIVDVQVVMSGFNISYENDHWIKKIEANTKNEALENGEFTFDVDCQMIDDSNHTGGGDFYATLIGTKQTDPNWKIKSWNPNDGKKTVSSTGTSGLVAAYVFIRGYVLKYQGSDDHKVKKMVVDAGNSNLLITENKDNGDGTWSYEVTFTPTLSIKDDSGNDESKSDSTLDLLVVFVETNP